MLGYWPTSKAQVSESVLGRKKWYWNISTLLDRLIRNDCDDCNTSTKLPCIRVPLDWSKKYDIRRTQWIIHGRWKPCEFWFCFKQQTSCCVKFCLTYIAHPAKWLLLMACVISMQQQQYAMQPYFLPDELPLGTKSTVLVLYKTVFKTIKSLFEGNMMPQLFWVLQINRGSSPKVVQCKMKLCSAA